MSRITAFQDTVCPSGTWHGWLEDVWPGWCRLRPPDAAAAIIGTDVRKKRKNRGRFKRGGRIVHEKLPGGVAGQGYPRRRLLLPSEATSQRSKTPRNEIPNTQVWRLRNSGILANSLKGQENDEW